MYAAPRDDLVGRDSRFRKQATAEHKRSVERRRMETTVELAQFGAANAQLRRYRLLSISVLLLDALLLRTSLAPGQNREPLLRGAAHVGDGFHYATGRVVVVTPARAVGLASRTIS